MRKFILGLLMLAFTATATQADQWNDALSYLNTSTQAVFPGGARPTITNLDITAVQGVDCSALGSAPAFSSELFAGPANSNVFGGCDPVSTMNINLSLFAREADLLGLQGQLGATNAAVASLQASFAALSIEVANENATLLHELRVQARQSDQGIAQALAMAGTADLQSDEHYAVSMNFGTFGGQTAFAAGAAARVGDHVSINAGFTAGTHGGPVGARAGIRFGW
jgi:autotransporter adhesin